MGASSGSEVASYLSAQCCLTGDGTGAAQGLCHPAPVVIAGGGGWWSNGTSARTTASAGGGVCDNCPEGGLLWAAVTSIMLYSVNISSFTWCVLWQGMGVVLCLLAAQSVFVHGTVSTTISTHTGAFTTSPSGSPSGSLRAALADSCRL